MASRNILMIQCDQLNENALQRCITAGLAPHLAKLQEESASFSAAYCQTPLCTPSRASLVTGLYPHKHGMVSNVMRRDYPVCGGPETEEGINAGDLTTEKFLWERGYRVAHVGKWHLSGEDLPYYPEMYREHYEYAREMKSVFREAENAGQSCCMDWYGWRLPVRPTEEFLRAAERIREPWRSTPRLHDFYSKIGPLCLKTEDTYDYRVASRSVEFLERTGGDPFLLTCSFNTPHDPNVVPLPYYERAGELELPLDPDPVCDPLFQGDLSWQVAQQGGREFLREFLRVYYACVMFLDEQVGRVLDALERSGQRENTAVVFLSDHGDMAGEHGMFWKSTGAFYDGVARVPLMISCPSVLPRGRYGFPVELVDLMPTLLELCGFEAPDAIQGKSLVPYCRGERHTGDLTALSERLEWNEAHTRQPRTYEEYAFMLRDGRYKYSLYRKRGVQTELLYDLVEDAGERRDLSGEPAMEPVLRSMRRGLLSRLMATGCAIEAVWMA